MVNGSYLILTTGRRLDVRCNINDLIGIEIESYYGIVALWFRRLLLNTKAVASFVKLSYTIAFRIVDPITEYCGFLISLQS